MREVDRSTEKTRHWPAWAGTIDDLDRLSKIVEEAWLARGGDVLDQFEREYTNRAGHDDDTQLARQVDERLRADDRAKIEREFRISTRMTDGDDTVTGRATTMLKELDRRTVDTLHFVGEYSRWGVHEVLDVRLTRSRKHLTGVRLTVSSSEPGWARQTFATASEEIEKGTPRWGWLQTPLGLMLSGLITYIPITWTIILIASPKYGSLDYWAWFAIASLIATVLNLVYALSPLKDWIFPPFEVLGEGGSPSGARRLGAIGSMALSVVIGVVVNLIS